MISRLCEEFNCLPSEAMVEPWGLALRIIRLRDYVTARQYIDQTKLEELKMTPMVTTVLEIQAKIQFEDTRGMGE